MGVIINAGRGSPLGIFETVFTNNAIFLFALSEEDRRLRLEHDKVVFWSANHDCAPIALTTLVRSVLSEKSNVIAPIPLFHIVSFPSNDFSDAPSTA